jgi:hypothetical protein
MLSKLDRKARAYVLLMAWILFISLGVSDTFDLSDDIVLPAEVGQPVIAADAPEEQKPHNLAIDFFLPRSDFAPFALRYGSDDLSPFSISFTRTDTPLYLRYSSYRI